MPAEELTFRVAYEGPLADFSRAHPGATLSMWCDWDREAVEVVGLPTEQLRSLHTILESRGGTEAYSVDDRTHVFLGACTDLPHDFVLKAIDEARCLPLPPTRFEQGWEVHHVVSFSEDGSRRLFKVLRDGGREVELLTKRKLQPNPLLSSRGVGVHALFDGLTEKQAHALLQAHRHGLYASPRKVTAADIADSLGLSRSTYEEHVRKAESRVVANLAPYLELWLKARTAPAPPQGGSAA
jgi:predicted DNA binding protein